MQRWDECEVNYKRSIELNPNYPLSHEWLSAILVGTGRFEEGTREVLLAEELDPLSLRPKVLSAWTIYQTRNYDLALSKARELQLLAPEFMQSYLQLSNVLTQVGPPDEAVQVARKAIAIADGSPLPVYNLCFALSSAGLHTEAEETVAKWEKIASDTYVPPYFLGLSNLAIGNTERALDLLDAARIEKSAWVLWLATEPKLDALRDNPRFIEIVEKAGLPILTAATGPGK
jgi:tetratricopeptide (TPR) repeat protein